MRVGLNVHIRRGGGGSGKQGLSIKMQLIVIPINTDSLALGRGAGGCIQEGSGAGNKQIHTELEHHC